MIFSHSTFLSVSAISACNKAARFHRLLGNFNDIGLSGDGRRRRDFIDKLFGGVGDCALPRRLSAGAIRLPRSYAHHRYERRSDPFLRQRIQHGVTARRGR